MKVLIMCDLFPPAFGPRMGYLCKYLVEMGWEPVVLTEATEDKTFAFLAGHCPVTRVNFYPARSVWLRKVQWLFTFLTGGKERRMFREAERMTRREAFDVLLCSTYRTFPLRSAARIARKHHLPWIADLRDMVEQYPGSEFIPRPLPAWGGFGQWLIARFKSHSIAIRNRALSEATCITTISPWHVALLKKDFREVRLVYNGFDPDTFFPTNKITRHFIITYTGRLLSLAMGDPSLLLEALSRLAKAGQLQPEQCRVRWYVNDASRQVIGKEATKWGVSPFMDFKEYVPAARVPEVLNDSSVLLVLTNSSAGKGPKGIMPTKFFEALAVRKPILCVRSDEGVLEQALQETHAGLAARKVEEVCTFLLKYLNEWQREGCTHSDADEEKIKVYSRREQAKEFIRIFEQAIGK